MVPPHVRINDMSAVHAPSGDSMRSLVLVLDETGQEQQFHRDSDAVQNGAQFSLHISQELHGLLSKDDVNMLLSMFDTVMITPSPSKCLSILSPKKSLAPPPPTLFLLPLSPQQLPTNLSNLSSSSPRSSTSAKKHPQSSSSSTNDDIPYGPNFLSYIEPSPYGTAHIIPVALCQQGEKWTQNDLVQLLSLGIRDILTVPCEPPNVGGLYMHLKDRMAHPLDEAVDLERYQKSRIATESRQATFTSWIENNTYYLQLESFSCARIIDLLVQSYAPQPNLLSRPIVAEELLATVTEEHLSSLADKVNDWDFHAGLLSGDDLIWASVLILEHVLNTFSSSLHQYAMSRDQLVLFMLTVRSCYQPTNYYHNFRHAIDVLQATFQIFLLSNLIPPLPSPNAPVPEPLPALLPEGYFGPFEILALCISAVGHDAAHPGVTNAFLTASKSSLATIFNQHSVLENLHCLTISRIVEERWPSLFADHDNTGTGDGARFRKFILEMILSTDMALHFDYMSKFEGLRNNISQAIDEKQKWLVGCCVMKSADISNLARPLNISKDWTLVLQKETSAQDDLLTHLNIPPLSPRPPPTSNPDPELQMAKGQIFFIDTFAYPLWNIGSQLFFPGMQYGVQQIKQNRKVWEGKLQEASTPRGEIKHAEDESFSTLNSATTAVSGDRSDATTIATPRTTSAVIEGGETSIRKTASNSDLSEEKAAQKRAMRKERSFSSLIFWKRKPQPNSSSGIPKIPSLPSKD